MPGSLAAPAIALEFSASQAGIFALIVYMDKGIFW